MGSQRQPKQLQGTSGLLLSTIVHEEDCKQNNLGEAPWQDRALTVSLPPYPVFNNCRHHSETSSCQITSQTGSEEAQNNQ